MLFLATKRQSPLPSPSAKMNWVVVEFRGDFFPILTSKTFHTARHFEASHFETLQLVSPATDRR
jgi:hypothetical protein